MPLSPSQIAALKHLVAITPAQQGWWQVQETLDGVRLVWTSAGPTRGPADTQESLGWKALVTQAGITQKPALGVGFAPDKTFSFWARWY